MKKITHGKRRLFLALVATFVITNPFGSSFGGLVLRTNAQQAQPQLPTYPLSFGAFTAQFDPGGVVDVTA